MIKAITALTQNIDLGDSGSGTVTTKVIQIDFGTLVGSIQVLGRVLGSGGGYKAIPYKKQFLNAAVGDQTWGSAAITDDSIIEVDSTGQEIRLAYTHTSGAGPGEIAFFDVDG
jgi:hypothetical protein